MLELLKKAEEIVKKFNNLPEEQRHYYDVNDKAVIKVTLIDDIRCSTQGNSRTMDIKYKGYDVSQPVRAWYGWFTKPIQLVTEEECNRNENTNCKA